VKRLCLALSLAASAASAQDCDRQPFPLEPRLPRAAVKPERSGQPTPPEIARIRNGVISASAGIQRLPKSEYTFSIQFGADPQRVGALVKRVFQEIDKLKNDGVTASQAADVKQLFLREFETNSKQNSYLLGQLAGKYQLDEDPNGVWLVPDYYNKIDPKMIQQAART